MKSRLLPVGFAIAFCVHVLCAQVNPKITTPKDALGFNLGDDYSVANYTQLEAYWKKLASESDRMKLVDIGPTSENRHQYMAIFSSPENMKKLDHYKEINARLLARHWDSATLRREFIGYRMMARERGSYWRLPESQWVAETGASFKG